MSKERVNQIYCVAGQNRIALSELVAGDIGATVKMKNVRTGNTLNGKDCELEFPTISYPEPKYRRAIKAQKEAEDKINNPSEQELLKQIRDLLTENKEIILNIKPLYSRRA